MWLISCASTPASSRADSFRTSASVTAIAESSRRPTAKALSSFDGMTWSTGTAGRPARRDSSSTMAMPVGNSAAPTGRALYMASTICGLTRRTSHSETPPKTTA